MSNKVFWRVAVAAWIGVIFFSSTSLASKWCESAFGYLSILFFEQLRPHSSPYELIHLIADKGLHVTLFCVLAILLWQAIASSRHQVWTILLCGAVIGSCSEFLQRFFPGRDPAIHDVAINVAGTAAGIAVCAVRRRVRRAHSTANAESDREAAPLSFESS